MGTVFYPDLQNENFRIYRPCYDSMRLLTFHSELKQTVAGKSHHYHHQIHEDTHTHARACTQTRTQARTHCTHARTHARTHTHTPCQPIPGSLAHKCDQHNQARGSTSPRSPCCLPRTSGRRSPHAQRRAPTGCNFCRLKGGNRVYFTSLPGQKNTAATQRQ